MTQDKVVKEGILKSEAGWGITLDDRRLDWIVDDNCYPAGSVPGSKNNTVYYGVYRLTLERIR